MRRATDWRALLVVVIATFLVGMVALLAYWLAYVHYPRFALPPLDVGLVLPLAVLAGLASLFSPCSFPLLLATFGIGTTVSKSQLRDGFYWRLLGVAIGASTFFAISWDSGGTWCGKDFGGSHIPQSSWPSLTDTCRPGSACIGSRATRCLGIPAWLVESLGTPDCPENGGGFVWASGLGWCRL